MRNGRVYVPGMTKIDSKKADLNSIIWHSSFYPPLAITALMQLGAAAPIL